MFYLMMHSTQTTHTACLLELWIDRKLIINNVTALRYTWIDRKLIINNVSVEVHLDRQEINNKQCEC